MGGQLSSTVLSELPDLQRLMPLPLCCLEVDNDMAFMNKDHKHRRADTAKPIELTRSRAYKIQLGAWVKQKARCWYGAWCNTGA